MSVINQMLKDLEQRRAQGFSSDAGMLDDLAGADDNGRTAASNNKALWIVVALLLVVLVSGGVYFAQGWLHEESTNAEIPTVNVLVEPQVPNAISVITPSTDKKSIVTQTLDTTAADPDVIKSIKAEQPEIILPVKESVIETTEAEQLTKPVEITSITKQMSIDAIVPKTLVANGAQKIITVHGNGFIPPLKVTMEWDSGSAFKDLEEQQIKIVDETKIQLHVNLGRTADDWRVIIKQSDNSYWADYKFSVSAEPKKVMTVRSKKVTEKIPANEASNFNKTATPLTIDEQVRLAYAEATHVLQQGKTEQAKQLLQKILTLDFTHIQTRETLSALLFKGREYEKAIEVLELGRIQHPKQVSFTLLLARIYTEQGRDPSAVDLLERIKPSVAQNSDYYALLAALYQRGAQYNKAALVYEKLLKVFPSRAVWWMGLGLSLQTTERKQDALLAYQKALAAEGLTVELKRFIKSRMRILEQG